MKYVTEFRNPRQINDLQKKITQLSHKKFNIMEICGGHTMAIKKNGLDKLIGKNINFLSGPGCPVCVTTTSEIDKLVYMTKQDNVCLCTFGDLFKVPGSASNLMQEKANGNDIRIVYSVHDALQFAVQEKNKKIIFAGIGFETTTPTTAAVLKEAKQKNITNFFIYSMHKTVPAAIHALLSDPDHQIHAFLLPGHVSTIIGANVYSFIPDTYHLPGCISGFEPTDIMGSVYALTELVEQNKAEIINFYPRVVKPEGNKLAQQIINEVYEPCDANWRGLGFIKNSGLKIREEYKEFDADKQFQIPEFQAREFPGCLCGEVLKGKKNPRDCKLYKKVCTPDDPKGACMVSSEGICAAWYLYG